jgi:hypothetical protein
VAALHRKKDCEQEIMLMPEGFGSPVIGVLCAGSPNSLRLWVGPEPKTNGLVLNRKRKGEKEMTGGAVMS